MTETTDVRQLSKLLFEAREAVDMFADVTANRVGRRDQWLDRLRDEIDAYRAERGWSPDGFGGEH